MARSAMRLSDAGAMIILFFEGFRPAWYRDAVGVGTIGIGFTWQSAAFRAWWKANKSGEEFGPGATMTKSEALAVLVEIIAAEYGAAVNRFLGKIVPQNVFDAMSSATFNLGPGCLDWTWATMAKAGDYHASAERLKVTGTTAKGRRLAGLVTRRREEAELLEFSDYTIGEPAGNPLADGMLVRKERGQPVADLQRQLAALGFYEGKDDGIFGYGTEAAVLEFQRSEGLDADGMAGPATLGALESKITAAPAIDAPAPRFDLAASLADLAADLDRIRSNAAKAA